MIQDFILDAKYVKNHLIKAPKENAIIVRLVFVVIIVEIKSKDYY